MPCTCGGWLPLLPLYPRHVPWPCPPPPPPPQVGKVIKRISCRQGGMKIPAGIFNTPQTPWLCVDFPYCFPFFFKGVWQLPGSPNSFVLSSGPFQHACVTRAEKVDGRGVARWRVKAGPGQTATWQCCQFHFKVVAYAAVIFTGDFPQSFLTQIFFPSPRGFHNFNVVWLGIDEVALQIPGVLALCGESINSKDPELGVALELL